MAATGQLRPRNHGRGTRGADGPMTVCGSDGGGGGAGRRRAPPGHRQRRGDHDTVVPAAPLRSAEFASSPRHVVVTHLSGPRSHPPTIAIDDTIPITATPPSTRHRRCAGDGHSAWHRGRVGDGRSAWHRGRAGDGRSARHRGCAGDGRSARHGAGRRCLWLSGRPFGGRWWWWSGWWSSSRWSWFRARWWSSSRWSWSSGSVVVVQSVVVVSGSVVVVESVVVVSGSVVVVESVVVVSGSVVVVESVVVVSARWWSSMSWWWSGAPSIESSWPPRYGRRGLRCRDRRHNACPDRGGFLRPGDHV